MTQCDASVRWKAAGPAAVGGRSGYILPGSNEGGIGLDDCVVLVDNSNLFIGGQQLSALRKGVGRQDGDHHDASDPSWRIDFDALLTCLAAGRNVYAAVMVG